MQRRALLVIGSLAAIAVLTPLVSAWGWTLAHPCWRSSNAEWCGHYCDDDPCACPDRHATADPFGGGPGCPDP